MRAETFAKHALKEWYDSPAYRELRELRKGALDVDLLFANGV